MIQNCKTLFWRKNCPFINIHPPKRICQTWIDLLVWLFIFLEWKFLVFIQQRHLSQCLCQSFWCYLGSNTMQTLHFKFQNICSNFILHLKTIWTALYNNKYINQRPGYWHKLVQWIIFTFYPNEKWVNSDEFIRILKFFKLTHKRFHVYLCLPWSLLFVFAYVEFTNQVQYIKYAT